jgi:hypothetical protein
MTRQVVWPQELLTRRLRLSELRRQVEQARAADGPSTHLEELRSELAALPCAHWEMEQHAAGVNDWTCIACGDVISAEWVPLADQERHLRRHTRSVLQS